MIENPDISVLMSVYNAEKFLSLAIDSILNQTFKNFEFIIINDGSTDNSGKIITSYTDPRIKLFDNPENLKVAKTCNRSISLAKGKYLVRMDADDIAMPERLAVQFDFMEKNPDIGLSGAWYESFGDITGIAEFQTENDKIRFHMLYNMPFSHPTTIIRKDIIEKNNIYYDPEYIGGEDYDFLIRISEVTKVANIPKVLLKYRQHSVSTKSNLHNEVKHFLFESGIYQFKRIGIEINEKDAEMFSRFCYSDFQFNIDEVDYIEKFLINTIEANNKSNYLNPDSLSKIIGEKWFHLCYNLSKTMGKKIYNKYSKSQLRKYYNSGSMAGFKFFIRRILK